jgi:hypothetical protein
MQLDFVLPGSQPPAPAAVAAAKSSPRAAAAEAFPSSYDEKYMNDD